MGLFIFIAIILCAWLCWPAISRWLKRQMANRAEDYIRKATGMPPRPDSREGRRRQREAGTSYGNSRQAAGAHASSAKKGYYGSNDDDSLIPKEYAEDVEFVETKSYSETTIDTHTAASSATYHESQVSDVEWVEIKQKK